MAVDGKRDGGRRRRRRKGVRRHPIYATDAAFYTGGREGGREAVGRLLWIWPHGPKEETKAVRMRWTHEGVPPSGKRKGGEGMPAHNGRDQMRLKSDPVKRFPGGGRRESLFSDVYFLPPFCPFYSSHSFPPIQRRRCPIYSHLLVGGTWQGALFRFSSPPSPSLPPSPFEPGNKIGGRLLLLRRHPISFSPRFTTLPFLRRGRGGPIFHPLLLREGLRAEMGGQTRRREKKKERGSKFKRRERGRRVV